TILGPIALSRCGRPERSASIFSCLGVKAAVEYPCTQPGEDTFRLAWMGWLREVSTFIAWIAGSNGLNRRRDSKPKVYTGRPKSLICISIGRIRPGRACRFQTT